MSSRSFKNFLSDRYNGLENNVWVEYTGLSVKHNAINLGQGFPDYPPPSYMNDALMEAMKSDDFKMNQYTRGYGHPRLVKALSALYSRLHDRNIDPMDEILVTVGGYESLFCSIMAFVNPGDEVIIIEPFFDCFPALVKLAGGTPRFIPLKPMSKGKKISSKDWKLDEDELRSLFNSKTKAIIFNNPNNPLGKVYSLDEMKVIARLCHEHDVLCISDEVYEWLVYHPNKHIRIATLPDMWDRTITIGSAGKTFSVTGWKMGWSVGPSKLIDCCKIAHQNCIYTCSTPLQDAIATGLELELTRLFTPQCYFQELAGELELKREKIVDMLLRAGFSVTVPEGGYFIMADWSHLQKDLAAELKGEESKDKQFVRWLTKEKKLAAIPPSAFYSQEHENLAEDFIRFCFFKKDSTIAAADHVLTQWTAGLTSSKN